MNAILDEATFTALLQARNYDTSSTSADAAAQVRATVVANVDGIVEDAVKASLLYADNRTPMSGGGGGGGGQPLVLDADSLTLGALPVVRLLQPRRHGK